MQYLVESFEIDEKFRKKCVPPLADGVVLPKLQKPILFSLHLNENTHTTICEYLLNQYHHDYISIDHFISNQ